MQMNISEVELADLVLGCFIGLALVFAVVRVPALARMILFGVIGTSLALIVLDGVPGFVRWVALAIGAAHMQASVAVGLSGGLLFGTLLIVAGSRGSGD